MNSLFGELGLAAWKAIFTALLLPPVPLLLLGFAGAWLLWLRRGIGWVLVVLGGLGLYLSTCYGVGQAMGSILLRAPPALSLAQIETLKASAQARKSTMIVVLGGGREVYAPEYGVANLADTSLARLRYGLWLGRATALPVGFSGGTGWGAADGLSEAEIAARIAADDFGRPLRWTETMSRDTRENALRTVAQLGPGITDIVLVTHGWHMPRAVRAFSEACASRCKVIAAPMGLAPRIDRQVMMWLPTNEGFTQVRTVLREWLGLLAGS